MRYIRFLKTPRVVVEKGTSKKKIFCLITITSDLGDSFLPYDVQLAAEILTSKTKEKDEEVRIWQTVEWKGSMRSLPITFPLPESLASSTLLMKAGVEPRSNTDCYSKLFEKGRRGLVSAWSAEFSSTSEAPRLVERRFSREGTNDTISIWEETGESIARHLWDAGITLACHMPELQDSRSKLEEALIGQKPPVGLSILELGTGCGIVGISLAYVFRSEHLNIVLTDLPEAREMVERNINQLDKERQKCVRFQELDWNEDLPEIPHYFSLILASDCTYNSDSSPALVNTLSRLAKKSPNARIATAMKKRHDSEAVFFDLMAAAGFKKTTEITWPLPGDEKSGEEKVQLFVYQLNHEE